MKRVMRHNAISASRLTGWLCLVAVWLQVLLPVALHSTAMTDIPSLIVFADADDDDGCALEDGTGPHADDHDGDHAAHAHSGCLACQAMHFMGGGSGAPVLAVAFAPLFQTLFLAAAFVGGSHGFALLRHFQARGPPAVSI